MYLVTVQHVSQVALGHVEDGGSDGLGSDHGLGRGGAPRRVGLLVPPPAPLPPAPRLRQLLLDLLNISEHLAGQRLQGVRRRRRKRKRRKEERGIKWMKKKEKTSSRTNGR